MEKEKKIKIKYVISFFLKPPSSYVSEHLKRVFFPLLANGCNRLAVVGHDVVSMKCFLALESLCSMVLYNVCPGTPLPRLRKTEPHARPALKSQYFINSTMFLQGFGI